MFSDSFEDPHVNVAPQISTDDGPLTLSENSQRTIRFQIIDPDVSPTQRVEVTLEVDNSASLTLPIRTGLDFAAGSGQDDSFAVFEGSLSAVNHALSSAGGGVQITPIQDFPGDVTLSASVSDLGNSGLGGPKTANAAWLTTYAETNTAPSISSADGLQTLLTNSLRIVNLQVSDPDVAPAQTVEIALAVDSGARLTLPVHTDLDFSTGDGDNDVLMEFQATIAAVNNALSSPGGGVAIAPSAGFVGDLTLTATVDDLGHSGEGGPKMDVRYWVTTYSASNSAPTISTISDRTIALNAPGGDTASFTVGDTQTAAGYLEVSADATPDPIEPLQVTLSLGGSDSERTITVAPAQDDVGKTAITVVVSDGTFSAFETYVLTVSVQ